MSEILQEQFETKYHDSDSVCPYCGHSYQVEAESYSEDDRVIECYECEKKYYLHQNFSVDHVSRPDCELNGEQHKYGPRSLGGGRFHPFCDVCGKCQPHSAART